MSWPQIQRIPTAGIHVGERLRPLRPELVDMLAASMDEDGLKVPIIVRYGDNYAHCLVAGLHRLHAAHKLGWTEIEASIDPDMDEAQGKRVEIIENLHRGELTTKERKEHAAMLLKLDPAKSNKSIADDAGLSDKTVATIRAEGEARSEIPHVEKRIDSKGRRQPAHKGSVGQVREGDPTKPELVSPPEEKPVSDRGEPVDLREPVPVHLEATPEANPIVAAWDRATREHQEEFLRYLAGRGWSVPPAAEPVQTAEAPAAVNDATEQKTLPPPAVEATAQLDSEDAIAAAEPASNEADDDGGMFAACIEVKLAPGNWRLVQGWATGGCKGDLYFNGQAGATTLRTLGRTATREQCAAFKAKVDRHLTGAAA